MGTQSVIGRSGDNPKRFHLLVACLLAAATLAAPALASDPAPGGSLYVILYRQGPAWKTGVPMRQQAAIVPHFKYMKQLFQEGTILEAGPTLDAPGGVVILRAASLKAATALMAADPSVTSKMFVGEIHSWSPSFHSPQPIPAPAAASNK